MLVVRQHIHCVGGGKALGKLRQHIHCGGRWKGPGMAVTGARCQSQETPMRIVEFRNTTLRNRSELCATSPIKALGDHEKCCLAAE